MTLRLKKLNVEIRIGQFAEQDVSKDIGDLLWVQSRTIAMSDLARKIYYDDEVTLTQAEYKEMMKVVTPAVRRYVVVAIELQVKEK